MSCCWTDRSFELEVRKARVLHCTVRRPTSERQRRASRSQTLQKCHRLAFTFGDLNFSLAGFAFAYRKTTRGVSWLDECARAQRPPDSRNNTNSAWPTSNKSSTRKSEMHRHESRVEEPSCRCCTETRSILKKEVSETRRPTRSSNNHSEI